MTASSMYHRFQQEQMHEVLLEAPALMLPALDELS